MGTVEQVEYTVDFGSLHERSIYESKQKACNPELILIVFFKLWSF